MTPLNLKFKPNQNLNLMTPINLTLTPINLMLKIMNSITPKFKAIQHKPTNDSKQPRFNQIQYYNQSKV